MLLKRLSEADGVSGNERAVGEILRQHLAKDSDGLQVDRLGNLIAFRRGRRRGPRVMVAAHMDEVGLIMSDIEANGLLRFKPVGGIDERVLVGKAVRVGKERVPGVIGAKPIHLQKPAERKKPFRRRDLFIDIGAADREKAREIVSVGDYVAFATAFGEFGTGRWKGKAFDDRVGCAILAELLADRYEFDLYGVFTVQEEVGLRGSGVAAFQLQPDIALVLEATTCADTPDNEQLCQVTKLGQGPAVTIRDNSVIADKGLVHMLEQTARRLSIPYQFRQGGAGGNDAGRIATTGPGVRVATLSVPTRYIHAPVSIIDQQDYHNTRKLAQGFLAALGGV